MAHARELQLLTTYENRIRRSVEKNTAELRALQKDRKFAPFEAQLERRLNARLEGGDDDLAGDLPPEAPDSSVRFFEGSDPASYSPEPEEFTKKPATQPRRPNPTQQALPQRVSPRPTIKQPEDTESEPWPSEFVRNPIGQLVPRR
jgi:hypothetical protein